MAPWVLEPRGTASQREYISHVGDGLEVFGNGPAVFG